MGHKCAEANRAKTNGSSYTTDVTLVSFEVHRMRQHRAMTTAEKLSGPDVLCNTRCGLTFGKRSALGSSIAIVVT